MVGAVVKDLFVGIINRARGLQWLLSFMMILVATGSCLMENRSRQEILSPGSICICVMMPCCSPQSVCCVTVMTWRSVCTSCIGHWCASCDDLYYQLFHPHSIFVVWCLAHGTCRLYEIQWLLTLGFYTFIKRATGPLLWVIKFGGFRSTKFADKVTNGASLSSWPDKFVVAFATSQNFKMWLSSRLVFFIVLRPVKNFNRSPKGQCQILPRWLVLQILWCGPESC